MRPSQCVASDDCTCGIGRAIAAVGCQRNQHGIWQLGQASQRTQRQFLIASAQPRAVQRHRGFATNYQQGGPRKRLIVQGDFARQHRDDAANVASFAFEKCGEQQGIEATFTRRDKRRFRCHRVAGDNGVEHAPRRNEFGRFGNVARQPAPQMGADRGRQR